MKYPATSVCYVVPMTTHSLCVGRVSSEGFTGLHRALSQPYRCNKISMITRADEPSRAKRRASWLYLQMRRVDAFQWLD